jgi:hypothetical protein
MSSGCSSGGPSSGDNRTAVCCTVRSRTASRDILSQEEVIAPRASALQLVVASWMVLAGRGEERALHQWYRRSLWFAAYGRTCCSTVGALSRPTLFVKNPLFVRPSVHPSVYTKLARFCNFLRSCSTYKSPASQPRTASVHRCHLLTAAFCRRSQDHSTRSSTHGPRPTTAYRPPATAQRHRRRHSGDSLAASRVRGALAIGAW